MSDVSGVVLHTSCVEDDARLAEINQWLAGRGFGHMVSVEDNFGGSKHPQTMVAGGGFNWFNDAAFAGFIMSLEWRCPQNVVLLISHEDDATTVYRP